MKLFELQVEGKETELDITPYKQWYFGDGESRYFFTVSTQYSVVENGTTFTTSMNPVDSAQVFLNACALPDPAITGVTVVKSPEGGSVRLSVNWENMQEFCQLQFAFTVNDSNTEYYTVYPDDENTPVNGSQDFFFAMKDFDTEPHEGDSIRCEVQVYRMVTSGGGFAVGEAYCVDFAVQPAEPLTAKIIGAAFSILRESSTTIRMAVTWEDKPLEDCVLEIGLALNDGGMQYFEVTPTGDNNVAAGTRTFDLETRYLSAQPKANDVLHAEFTFIRDTDGSALSPTYRTEATVKPATMVENIQILTVVATYAKTGEQQEFTSSSQEASSSNEVIERAKNWLIKKGATEDSIKMLSYEYQPFKILCDGVEVTEEEFLSGDYDPDTISFVSPMILYLIAEEPAILGDTDGDGIVSVLDATVIQKVLASIDVPDYNEAAADVDGDKKVTVIDATYIQKWLAHIEAPEGIGKRMV